MSEEPTQIPADAPAPAGASRVEMPPPADSGGGSGTGTPEVVDQHPELVVAGAFAGAYVFAKILRRIGGR